MPGIYKDEGIVLKTIKLGEADRIITLFTRDSGKLRAVAKGIRKTKSRFGGRLEPFTRAALIVYRGRNLDTITSADILTSFRVVREDYARLTAAATLAEIVEKITPEDERSFSVFALLNGGLEALTVHGPSTIVPAFLIKLLSLSGYHPQLGSCAGCEDRNSFALARDRLELLSRLLRADFGVAADGDATFEVTGALRRYAEYHIERPLRSL